jgi:Coenzyme PQQ synthesis protein D (PqqD)
MTRGMRPHDEVVWRRLEDEVVIVHVNTNRIYKLNSTAARFWELLAEGRDRDSAERALMEEFEVEAAEVRRETDLLVAELAAEGLLA